MAEVIYYCKKENNNCPRKDDCKRYIDSENKECCTTLFKVLCTEKNGHVLFLKKELKKEGEN